MGGVDERRGGGMSGESRPCHRCGALTLWAVDADPDLLRAYTLDAAPSLTGRYALLKPPHDWRGRSVPAVEVMGPDLVLRQARGELHQEHWRNTCIPSADVSAAEALRELVVP